MPCFAAEVVKRSTMAPRFCHTVCRKGRLLSTGPPLPPPDGPGRSPSRPSTSARSPPPRPGCPTTAPLAQVGERLLTPEQPYAGGAHPQAAADLGGAHELVVAHLTGGEAPVALLQLLTEPGVLRQDTLDLVVD